MSNLPPELTVADFLFDDYQGERKIVAEAFRMMADYIWHVSTGDGWARDDAIMKLWVARRAALGVTP